jgi:hypothetical protein
MRYNRISRASSLQTRTSSWYRPRLQRGRSESAFVTLNKNMFNDAIQTHISGILVANEDE